MAEAAVSVGSPYCVDAHEVSFQQYQDFLTKSILPSTQPEQCSNWNTSFTEQNLVVVPGSQSENNPVTNVNWCDAYMYCFTYGKHLCGSTESAGPVAVAISYDPTSAHGPPNSPNDEWWNACNGNTELIGDAGADASAAYTGLVYTTGNAYLPEACNGPDSPAQASASSRPLVPVAIPPGTAGNYVQSGPPCVTDNMCNPAMPQQYRTVAPTQNVTCNVGKPPSDGGTPPVCGLAFEEPTCHNSAQTIFDMNGNVAEWENSCNGTSSGAAGANDKCLVRGGSFDSPDGINSMRCSVNAAQVPVARNTAAPDIGFRCCL